MDRPVSHPSQADLTNPPAIRHLAAFGMAANESKQLGRATPPGLKAEQPVVTLQLATAGLEPEGLDWGTHRSSTCLLTHRHG